MEDVILEGSDVYANTAQFGAGGVSVDQTTSATLAGNRIYDNATADYGGGLVLGGVSSAALAGNRILSNTAELGGGGLYLLGGMNLTNIVFIGNRTAGSGSGLFIGGGVPSMPPAAKRIIAR